METIIAALIGLVGVVMGVLAFWIRAGFQDLRSSMEQGFAAAERRVDGRFDTVDGRFDTVDGRFEKVGERFDKVEVILREHGERLARMEGALAASGLALPLPAAAAERPVLGSPATEAAAG